jgi:hypothetical protein
MTSCVRFFLGKNKVMALALGRTPEEEPKENLHKISQVVILRSALDLKRERECQVLIEPLLAVLGGK